MGLSAATAPDRNPDPSFSAVAAVLGMHPASPAPLRRRLLPAGGATQRRGTVSAEGLIGLGREGCYFFFPELLPGAPPAFLV